MFLMDRMFQSQAQQRTTTRNLAIASMLNSLTEDEVQRFIFTNNAKRIQDLVSGSGPADVIFSSSLYIWISRVVRYSKPGLHHGWGLIYFPLHRIGKLRFLV